MSLRDRAEHTTKAVAEALQQEITGEQAGKIAAVIEKAIIKVVLEERERCVTVANKCCPEDQDKAHKIAAQIVLKEQLRKQKGHPLNGLRSSKILPSHMKLTWWGLPPCHPTTSMTVSRFQNKRLS